MQARTLLAGILSAKVAARGVLQPQALSDASPPCTAWTGLPELQPMSCGMLLFIHIDKTGGEAVWNHLEKTRYLSGFETLQVWNQNDPTFDYRTDSKWITAIHQANHSTRPKIVLGLHNGVPGIGDHLWSEVFAPLKTVLEGKGCELRMTTVLRDGFSRMVSGFKFALQNSQHQRQDMNIGSTSRGSRHATTMTECAFADYVANDEVKYLLGGDVSQWPREYHWSPPQGYDDAGPASKSAQQVIGGVVPTGETVPALVPTSSPPYGNASYDRQVLLPRAQSVLALMSFVGQTEDLESYLNALDRTLGVTVHVKDTTVNPTHVDAVVPTAAEECFRTATAEDDALRATFCPQL